MNGTKDKIILQYLIASGDQNRYESIPLAHTHRTPSRHFTKERKLFLLLL